MAKKTTRKKAKHHVKQKPMVSPTPDKGTHVQRNHKDTLFRFIFRDKEKLLQLYNALNHSDYSNPLLDYSRFIYYIRINQKQGYSIDVAIDMAVECCLKEDILTDVLRVHRKEVTTMFLEDYERDMEIHERTLRREAIEQGLQQGIQQGQQKINQLNQKLLQDNRMDDLLRATQDSTFQEKLLKEYGI